MVDLRLGARLLEEDIRRLEVAVQHPPAVHVVDRLGRRGHQLGRRPGVHRSGMVLEPGGQAPAGAVGAGDVADRPVLAGLVDRHQVGVVQPGGGVRLT